MPDPTPPESTDSDQGCTRPVFHPQKTKPQCARRLGFAVPGDGGHLPGLAKAHVPVHSWPCFRVPLFFRRYEPDQVRRVRWPLFSQRFASQRFRTPRSSREIGASAPAQDTGQTPRLSASKTAPALARHALAAINAENQTTMALAEPTCLRSSNFWILPVLVLGSSPNTTARGTL